MSIVGRSYLPGIPARRVRTPAPHEGRDPDGYGRRIPTGVEVQINGINRWRPVFVCCISNAGTAYVEEGKNWHVIEGSLP